VRFAPALIIALSLAATAPPAAARVVDCNSRADFNLRIDSARNMSCRDAVRELRRHKRSISRTFTTPGGFRCYRVSGGRLGGEWRCVKGSRAFRFEFGD
jgi:hypothetical protein